MTNEPKNVVDRHLAIALASELVERAHPLLEEVVNFGASVLSRCKHHVGPLPISPEDRALLSLLRHVLEMTDAADSLIRVASSSAVDPLLRSALEAYFAIAFIAFDNTKRARRGRAYMVSVLQKQLKDLRTTVPGTVEQNQLLSKVQADKYVAAFVPKPDSDIDQQILRIEEQLSTPELKPIVDDHAALKKQPGEKKAKWHRLDGGPKTIEELASAVGHSGVYEVLYRSWSTYVHAQDSAAPSDPNWPKLRQNRGIKVAADLMSWIAVESTRIVLVSFRPADWDEMVNWYNGYVRPSREAMDAVDISGISPDV